MLEPDKSFSATKLISQEKEFFDELGVYYLSLVFGHYVDNKFEGHYVDNKFEGLDVWKWSVDSNRVKFEL